MKIRSLVAVATTAAVLRLTACVRRLGRARHPVARTTSSTRWPTSAATPSTTSIASTNPPTLADIEDAAAEAIEVLTETQRAAGRAGPARGPRRRLRRLPRQRRRPARRAGRPRGRRQGRRRSRGRTSVSAELGELSQRRSDLADDLGVDECVNDDERPTHADHRSGHGDTGATSPDHGAGHRSRRSTLPPTVPPQTVAPGHRAARHDRAGAGQLFAGRRPDHRLRRTRGLHAGEQRPSGGPGASSTSSPPSRR